MIAMTSGCGSSQKGVSAKSPGDMFFRPVICTLPPQSSTYTLEVPASAACQSRNPDQIASTEFSSISPETAGMTVILPYIQGGVRYVLGPADLTTSDIAGAKVVPTNGGYEVELTLRATGRSRFNTIAAQRYPYYQQDPTNPPPQSREAIEQGETVFVAAPIEADNYTGVVIVNTPGMGLGMATQFAAFANEMIKDVHASGSR